MAEALAPDERASGVDEVHILWISEGMSCDGDTVSITAAGQPGTLTIGRPPAERKSHPR